jgi:hypothetical protein
LDRGFSLRRLKTIITGLRSGKAPPARQGRRTTRKPRQGG